MDKSKQHWKKVQERKKEKEATLPQNIETEQTKKKIYISGSISGNLEHYKEQFEKAELKLKAAGHEVLNPARNPGNDYKEYIDIGLFELMRCTTIYLLPGWKNSKGAKLEYEYAKVVGLEIMEE